MASRRLLSNWIIERLKIINVRDVCIQQIGHRKCSAPSAEQALWRLASELRLAMAYVSIPSGCLVSYPGIENGLDEVAKLVPSTMKYGEEVIVVGGGNSAGQAAVFLARTTKHVASAVGEGSIAIPFVHQVLRE